MRRKLVVAAVGVLSVIHGPAFAWHFKSWHFKPWHFNKKPYYKYVTVTHDDRLLPAPVELCPVIKRDFIMDKTTQNRRNVLSSACMRTWFDRIRFGGGVNVDIGKWGNRNAGNPVALAGAGNVGYTGENTNRVSLNDAYLNVAADVNRWVQGFMSLSYLNASNFYSVAYQATPSGMVFGDNNNKLNLQQGYLRISNSEVTPLYAELGQQFQDFSRYDIHPITETMAQSLSETLRTSLKLGLIQGGFNSSIYSFQDPIPKISSGTRNFNYGLGLGYEYPSDYMGLNVGADYLYNIQGINLIGNTTMVRGGVGNPGFYHTRVGAVALYADLNYHALIFSGRYTTADHRMDPMDLPYSAANMTKGAKPWAASLQAAYGFYWRKSQQVYGGFQASRQTVYLNLPRDRWVVGYGVNVLRHTTVTAEWNHDIPYPVLEGGAPQASTNLVSARVAMTF